MRSRSIRVGLAASVIACFALSGCSAAGEPPIPTPDALTAAQSDALLDAQLDQAWHLRGAPEGTERPDVPIVRMISRGEWGEVMASCMNEQGFAVTTGADGGIDSGSLAESQVDAYNAAIFTCTASYPTDPKYDAPLNEAQRRYLHDYVTTELSGCLDAEGYETSDPPSWQAYNEQLDAGSTWNPYNDLPGLSPRRFQELDAACPQIPPRLFG